MEIKLQDRTIDLAPELILTNDVTFTHEFNPHNVIPWVIGHEYGPICLVWASNEQDAFDEACDADLLDSFLVEDEDFDPTAEYTAIGNAGENADLDNAWIEKVDLSTQSVKLIIGFAEARGGNYDSLNF